MESVKPRNCGCACCSVGGSRCVPPAPDPPRNRLGIDLRPPDHPALAELAHRQALALARKHGEADDRVIDRLPVHLRQHDVRLGLGEEATALSRRKLGGITQNQHRHAEAHQVVAEFLIHHRAFVDETRLAFFTSDERLMTKVGSSAFVSRAR